ncbi:UNVERIFIED_CONTAM: hypothetical protein K2H54_014312 [Gekko kuhli]
MFRDFGRRLQRDLKRVVDARLKASEELSGSRIKPKPVEVQVISHHMQRYAVWFGGSMLASTPEFFQHPLGTEASALVSLASDGAPVIVGEEESGGFEMPGHGVYVHLLWRGELRSQGVHIGITPCNAADSPEPLWRKATYVPTL